MGGAAIDLVAAPFNVGVIPQTPSLMGEAVKRTVLGIVTENSDAILTVVYAGIAAACFLAALMCAGGFVYVTFFNGNLEADFRDLRDRNNQRREDRREKEARRYRREHSWRFTRDGRAKEFDYFNPASSHTKSRYGGYWFDPAKDKAPQRDRAHNDRYGVDHWRADN